ncbi:hypothetical protein NDU88_002635 [Pleurodeles waltl]|uniref:Uncharacterized protein n=1 Tax=Pleurodeles waltl TaxID=8319 RepID=A0AAV7L1T2_PLEWA|nr:hypothetical protein NDU88_002635 [Pleurodeles waltl]
MHFSGPPSSPRPPRRISLLCPRTPQGRDRRLTGAQPLFSTAGAAARRPTPDDSLSRGPDGTAVAALGSTGPGGGGSPQSPLWGLLLISLSRCPPQLPGPRAVLTSQPHYAEGYPHRARHVVSYSHLQGRGAMLRSCRASVQAISDRESQPRAFGPAVTPMLGLFCSSLASLSGLFFHGPGLSFPPSISRAIFPLLGRPRRFLGDQRA